MRLTINEFRHVVHVFVDDDVHAIVWAVLLRNLFLRNCFRHLNGSVYGDVDAHSLYVERRSRGMVWVGCGDQLEARYRKTKRRGWCVTAAGGWFS